MNKNKTFFSKLFNKIFIKNTSLQLLKILIGISILLIIGSTSIYMLVSSVMTSQSYWGIKSFLNISRISFLMLIVNYLYIVLSYSIMFMKIFIDERNKFYMKNLKDKINNL